MNANPLSFQSPGTVVPEHAQVQLLEAITRKINLGASLEETFELIYERLHAFVPYNRIAVALTDEARERLYIIAAKSDGKVVLGRGYSGVIAGSSLEPLIRGGKIRVINDLQDYLEKKPASDSTRLIVREGMKSSLTLPLLIEGKPVGVMFFSSRAAGVYRPEHEDFLRNIVGHMSIAVERARLVDGLRERTEFLENILQSSLDGIVVVDGQNRIKTWNEGARRIFGYSAQEAIGQPYELLLAEEDRSGPEARRIQEAVEKNGFLRRCECLRRNRDGRRLVVEISATLLKDKKGRPIGRSCITRDVTDVKAMQQELVRTQSLAAVGEMAATVAHEIKNPLAGISGAIQVLAEGMPKQDRRRVIVGEILDQVKRLDTTVRDLLNFARPITPTRQVLDLAESISSAWKMLAPQSEAKAVRFSLEGGPGAVVSADPQLLRQVWVNLFQNSIEAMPKGGELLARVSGGKPVRVEIRDSGNGVDASAVGNIWRPFFTTKTRGTGLGLPIVKKIIEAHGGRIWCESEPLKRTSFFVEIPQ
ncbi:MAG: PAS domain S-box protein [Planctomycetes bacterium]|nr:PAS domain S-box protein [Planctomycetota bacterium]